MIFDLSDVKAWLWEILLIVTCWKPVPVEVNTPEDLAKARIYIRRRQLPKAQVVKVERDSAG